MRFYSALIPKTPALIILRATQILRPGCNVGWAQALSCPPYIHCRRKIIYLTAIIAATIGWGAAIYIPSLPLWAFVVLATLGEMACGAIIIGFAFAKETVPVEPAGKVSGVRNMGAMSNPMFLQPAIGMVLDLRWNGTLINGACVYDLDAYRAGFLLMMAWLVLAVASAALTRNTRCRQFVAEEAARR